MIAKRLTGSEYSDCISQDHPDAWLCKNKYACKRLNSTEYFYMETSQNNQLCTVKKEKFMVSAVNDGRTSKSVFLRGANFLFFLWGVKSRRSRLEWVACGVHPVSNNFPHKHILYARFTPQRHVRESGRTHLWGGTCGVISFVL